MASQNRVERGDLNIPKDGEPDPTRGLPLLLSPAMAARELSMSEKWIRRRISDKTIPIKKIGRSVRIRRETVLQIAGVLDASENSGEK